MNSFLTKNTIFTVLGILLTLFVFSSCEKPDKYIDWKVINEEWYEAHKNDPGFTVTESGLAYRRISPEANPKERQPNQGDWVDITYKGTYIDGKQFDSGTEARLGLPQTVTGFREGILKMREGETWEFYIPYRIGYGDKGSGAIPPYSTLIFNITLVSSGAY